MKLFIVLALALASLTASADRIEIGKGKKLIKISDKTVDLEVKIAIPLYKIEERIVIERVTCRVPVCSTEIGDGTDGKWFNFFTVPKAQKADALAKAIKGIGMATAEKIVDFDLFTFKPDSWTEFKTLIKKIEGKLEARGYNYKFATQVNEQYGYENMINLGYGNERSCRMVESLCDQVVVKEFKTLAYYLNRDLSVTVKNQTLQSFENDEIEITAGNEKNDIAIRQVSGFNNYEATLLSRGTLLELDGTRIMRPFPVNEVTATMAKDVDNNFVVTVNVPKKFETEKNATLKATFELCRADWFGGCFDVVRGPIVNSVVKSKLSATISTQGLKKGSKYFVRLRLNKEDSKYYSSAKSNMVFTNSIKN